MTDLLMLLTSRGRPHAVRRTYQEFLNTKTGSSELIVLVDDDDPLLHLYEEFSREMGYALEVDTRLRLTGSLNRSAVVHAKAHPFIGWLGDDTSLAHVGWDSIFIDELSRLGTGIVYGNDLLQCGVKPAALVTMTSNIVRKLGYMAPAELVHMCIDDAWQQWGLGINKLTYFPDVAHEHLHFSNGKSGRDSTYAESDSLMSRDCAQWGEYVNSGRLQADIARLKELL